ncbi:MAG: hypothetical protein HY858_10795 [Candidatus Solibacter usitatus]|nr:hypothetical protein [Candidatus Solibacter usitatus]
MLTRRLLMTAVLALCAAAQEMTVEQVLQKNLEAVGGKEAIQAINTLAIDSRMSFQAGEAPMKIRAKRPAMVRSEITVQGRDIVSAWDGATAWMINPMMGSGEPQKMDAEMTKSISENADMDASLGALAMLKKEGDKFELLGKQDVAGSPAYKVKFTRKGGEVRTYYLDAKSWLPVKVEMKVRQMGQELDIESLPGDYRKVAGITMPFQTDQRMGGNSMMLMKVEKVEVNQPLDDALFRMPAPPPKAAEQKK